MAKDKKKSSGGLTIFGTEVPVIILRKIKDHIILEQKMAKNVDNNLVFDIDGTTFTISASSEHATPIIVNNRLCYLIGYENEKIYKPEIETVQKINLMGYPKNVIERLLKKQKEIQKKLKMKEEKFWDIISKYAPIIQVIVVFIASFLLITSVLSQIDKISKSVDKALKEQTEILKNQNKLLEQLAKNNYIIPPNTIQPPKQNLTNISQQILNKPVPV